MRAALRSLGVLGWLEKHRHRRVLLWIRTLFAIYDFEDLRRLDLPWWTFSAIDRIEAFLATRPGSRVFEYGSGSSTCWLARRAGTVISVEHDPEMAGIVVAATASFANVRILQVPPSKPRDDDAPAVASATQEWSGFDFSDYVSSIDREPGSFDLIVIDGRCRAACLRSSMHKLAPDGMIVFDNSARKRYRETIAECGLAIMPMRGLTVCLPYPDETTLLSARHGAVQATDSG
jgi:precorrin-6B methylase 2